jgi:hypothetical protein
LKGRRLFSPPRLLDKRGFSTAGIFFDKPIHA